MSNISPQAFQVMSKSKVPDEAWLLTKYVTADEGNVIMCSKVSMPANKNVDFTKISPLEPWQNKLLQDGLKTGRPEVPHPNIKPKFTTIINEEMDQLMAKTKTGAAGRQGDGLSHQRRVPALRGAEVELGWGRQ